ncbi:MAG TPA: 50S ribosomal protein L30 [bacterium]|nr:50S ribosomal protein L30 [bacterium]
MQKLMKIKLVHSTAGRLPKQLGTVRGLGLKRLGQERVIEDTPCTRGMVKKVPHLVRIVEEGIAAPKA